MEMKLCLTSQALEFYVDACLTQVLDLNNIKQNLYKFCKIAEKIYVNSLRKGFSKLWKQLEFEFSML